MVRECLLLQRCNNNNNNNNNDGHDGDDNNNNDPNYHDHIHDHHRPHLHWHISITASTCFPVETAEIWGNEGSLTHTKQAWKDQTDRNRAWNCNKSGPSEGRLFFINNCPGATLSSAARKVVFHLQAILKAFTSSASNAESQSTGEFFKVESLANFLSGAYCSAVRPERAPGAGLAPTKHSQFS